MKRHLKWEKELVRKNKRDIQRVCTMKIQPITVGCIETTMKNGINNAHKSLGV
jgi:hypothetical protein